MKTLLFIDIETTGIDPELCQMWQFAAVPMINGTIFKNKVFKCHIRHDGIYLQRRYINKFGFPPLELTKQQLATGWKEYNVIDFENQFKKYLLNIFPKDSRITLAGKNVAGFDRIFLYKMCPQLKNWDNISYSVLDIAPLFMQDNDTYLPSLKVCRERAIERGWNVSVDNTHNAYDDALLTAELYSYIRFGHVTNVSDAQIIENSEQLDNILTPFIQE